MRKLSVLIACLLAAVPLFAQNDSTVTGEKVKGEFYGGLLIKNNNVWRGVMCANTLSFEPTVGFGIAGFNVYTTASYAIEDKYAEVDVSLSYEWKGLKLEAIDYYYPHLPGGNCPLYHLCEGDEMHYCHDFFNMNTACNSHQLDVILSYDPESFPMHFLWSTIVCGIDKNYEEDGSCRQAYSSYCEVGYWHEFDNYGRLDVTLGASIFRSDYIYGNEKFGLVNIGLQYGKAFDVGIAEIPVFASFVYNPVAKCPYMTLGVGVDF